jgi:hypothetical protein
VALNLIDCAALNESKAPVVTSKLDGRGPWRVLHSIERAEGIERHSFAVYTSDGADFIADLGSATVRTDVPDPNRAAVDLLREQAELIAAAPELRSQLRKATDFIEEAPDLDMQDEGSLSWAAVANGNAKRLLAMVKG